LDAVIDINHSCVVTDFAAVRNRGSILAVVHKASEGGDWLDPLYGVRRPQAEAAGLLWGAYHFGTRQYSGAQQAAAFLAAVQPGPATLMALDLEPNERHLANTMDIARAEDFVQTIYQATGRLPLVYTHPAWANGRPYGRAGANLGGAIGPHSILARCDLWLADYRMQPELPWAWANRGWRLWQYAGDDVRGGGGPFGSLSRAVGGVDRCDRNLFGGDASALYRFWTGGAGTV
jgi:lysozyme